MRAVQKALLERVMRGKKVRKMTEQGVRNVPRRAQTTEGVHAQSAHSEGRSQGPEIV